MDDSDRSRIQGNDGEDYYAEVYVSDVPTIRIDEDDNSKQIDIDQ